MTFRFLFGAAVVAALLSTTAIASAAPHHGGAYTCSGGVWTGDPSTSTWVSIPSNTYDSIKVTGVCDVVPDAVINVKGDITVARGGLFNAQSAPSTITVGHDVTAGAGSLLGLGCQSNFDHTPHPCAIEPDGASVITVNGDVKAKNAFLVLLNGITVRKNVELTGGGGGDWAEKHNTIGGNLSIHNVTPDWMGIEFNNVLGNVDLKKIWAIDPGDGGFGAVNVVVNTIGHDLHCSGLGPRLTGGIFDGEVNIVTGKTTGQCVGLVGSSS